MIRSGEYDACLPRRILYFAFLSRRAPRRAQQGSEAWLSLTSDHPYGIHAGNPTLNSNIQFVTPDEPAVSGGFMGTAINVGEVYAHLVRDVREGTCTTPGFDHALHNARLIETIRRAAEIVERQKITSV